MTDDTYRFFEASSLNEYTTDGFVARSNRWESGEPTLSIFDQSAAEHALPAIDDRFQQLLAARSSVRSFDERPIPTSALAELFAAAGAQAGRPVVPSAGGLDPLALYGVVRRGEAPFDGQVVRYVAANHRLAPIASVPDEDRCRRLFGLDCDGTPALLLVVAFDPGPTLAKYGNRGGRFLFQQVGHAMQNVGLRLADTQRRRRGVRLHGYVVGGVLDELAEVVGIAHTRAVIAGGYAIGRS